MAGEIVGWKPVNEDEERVKFELTAQLDSLKCGVNLDLSRNTEGQYINGYVETGWFCWINGVLQFEYERRSTIEIEKVGTGYYIARDAFGDNVSMAVWPAMTRHDLVEFVESLGYRVTNKEVKDGE